MSRYFIEVMYDGTAFHGSQLQANAPSVQLALNDALTTVLRQPVETFGASRTDAGVHALSNFYHFDLDTPLPRSLKYSLNAILPSAMTVKNIALSKDPEMNARFAAIKRSYRYKLSAEKNPFYHNRLLFYPFRLNIETLNQTAEIIKEYRDFESFCKRNSQTFTFLSEIFESRWEQHGDQLHYIVTANRFLRGMVRGLTGTQLQAARGRITPEDFRKIIEAKDCTLADFSVAGHGLYLEKIEYPEGSLQVIDMR